MKQKECGGEGWVKAEKKPLSVSKPSGLGCCHMEHDKKIVLNLTGKVRVRQEEEKELLNKKML